MEETFFLHFSSHTFNYSAIMISPCYSPTMTSHADDFNTFHSPHLVCFPCVVIQTSLCVVIELLIIQSNRRIRLVNNAHNIFDS